jgi:hypothetical protein
MLRRGKATSAVTLAAFGALLSAGCGKENVRDAVSATASDVSPPGPGSVFPDLPDGFTCCNFHYDGDRIEGRNYANLPMIPAGAPIKVTGYGRDSADVEIGGRSFRLGLERGRSLESGEQRFGRLIVDKDPKVRLDSFPAAVREAIRRGQIMVGMTKEQVIISLGYPVTSESPPLAAPFWRYWWSRLGEYKVHWSSDGRVSGVTGDSEIVTLVTAPGNATLPPVSTAKPADGAGSAATLSGVPEKGVEENGKFKSGN